MVLIHLDNSRTGLAKAPISKHAGGRYRKHSVTFTTRTAVDFHSRNSTEQLIKSF
jgi:hypothetical protein